MTLIKITTAHKVEKELMGFRVKMLYQNQQQQKLFFFLRWKFRAPHPSRQIVGKVGKILQKVNSVLLHHQETYFGWWKVGLIILQGKVEKRRYKIDKARQTDKKSMPWNTMPCVLKRIKKQSFVISSDDHTLSLLWTTIAVIFNVSRITTKV